MYKDSFKEMFECIKDVSFVDMTCSDDLYAFGGKLYLVDRRKIYGSSNPRIFVNYSDYLVYAKTNNCKIVDQRNIKTLPVKHKKALDLIDDSTESYLKQCNKKVAILMDKAGNNYNNHNEMSERVYSSALNYRYDNDVEKCMLDMILSEH
jgi:hypothetical protein